MTKNRLEGERALLDGALQRLGSISLFIHAASPRRLEGRHDHGDEGTGARAGIRLNAIAPGAIPGGGFVASNLDELVAQIPLGRPGTPDDVAQMAVTVLSERFDQYVAGTQ
jgi:enoyl-ACP reductase-like protein